MAGIWLLFVFFTAAVTAMQKLNKIYFIIFGSRPSYIAVIYPGLFHHILLLGYTTAAIQNSIFFLQFCNYFYIAAVVYPSYRLLENTISSLYRGCRTVP